MIEQKGNFSIGGVKNRRFKLQVDNKTVSSREDISLYESEITPISTMKYSQFLKELSKTLFINIKTLHRAFINSNIDINRYLSSATVRVIKQNFNNFLKFKAIDNLPLSIKVSNSIHPHKLTTKMGKFKGRWNSSDIGNSQIPKNKGGGNYPLGGTIFGENPSEGIWDPPLGGGIFPNSPKNPSRKPVRGGGKI